MAIAKTLGSKRAMNRSPETINLLLTRRSLLAAKLVEPGPTQEELQTILRCGARVPDHKGVNPWRIQVARSRHSRHLPFSIAIAPLRKPRQSRENAFQRSENRPFASYRFLSNDFRSGSSNRATPLRRCRLPKHYHRSSSVWLPQSVAYRMVRLQR